MSFAVVSSQNPSMDAIQNYEDKGPVIDAVVWNDGSLWRVALDTQEMDDSGAGKLADFTPLTNYRFFICELICH